MNKSQYENLSREQLIDKIQKLEKERYGLVWEDKEENVAKRCESELPLLEEDYSREIVCAPTLPYNIIIEGDNYHSLYALSFTHKKSIADYLKRMNPKRRGFGKRHLYNMVKFYDTYSTDEFNQLGKLLRLDEFVQLPIAQTEEGEIAQSVPTQLPLNEIVQSPIAQLDTPLINMPRILALATFTSHIEIMNRCKSYDERVFYMLYAARQRLNIEELRRCIVNQTYSTLLDKDKMLSPQLLKDYPSSEYLLKDKAVVDFLGLPAKHNEHHLHKGLLEHMKEFILELGKDFLFVDSEYGVQVGGSTKRIDLLFYHRALQCLVAIELKAVDFQPEFVGKMDMYLEALDRDVKRDNENPSIGIILCPSADRSMVEYTLSRSLSPTMVAEYQRKLIPQEVMRKSLEEYCSFIKDSQ